MKKSFYAENLHKGFSIVILLSCAGRLEDEAGRPAAGQTGKNLEMILKKLGLSRARVTINNASDKVFFAAKDDGRTEARPAEILSPRNIRRLKRELLPDAKIIIAMGTNAYKAATALKKLCPELIVIKARHPGFSSLNRIKVDCYKNPITVEGSDATKLRIEVVVKKIKEQEKMLLKGKKLKSFR